MVFKYNRNRMLEDLKPIHLNRKFWEDEQFLFINYFWI